MHPTQFTVTAADSAEDVRQAKLANLSVLSEEAQYRFVERLGALCGADKPTAGQVALAWKDASDYESRRRKGE